MKRSSAIFYGLLVLSMIAGTWTAARAIPVSAQSVNQAGIVVRLNDESVMSQCVAFDSQTVSGLELLQDSGLNVELRVEGLGNAVCRINGTGCATGNCFCQCSGGDDCIYWSYWHLNEGSWAYAAAGASSYQVSHGNVDGWSWGPGSISQAVEPPLMSFEEICGQDPGFVSLESKPTQGDSRSYINLAAFGGLLLVIVIGLVQVRRRRTGQ